MIPWETVDRARAPGGGELVLYRRGGEFMIRVDGLELMSSRAHGSEEHMASAACRRLGEGARVLVGGLGMGYTLRATLDALPAAAEVLVAEIVPQVVEWNRGPLAGLAGRPLDDPRARVEVGDVMSVLRATQLRFDAVLLDVDNGPKAMTRKGNHVIYGDQGLTSAKRALKPGGALAVWSASRDEPFVRRMRRAGFAVEVVDVPARGTGGGPKHTIFLGKA